MRKKNNERPTLAIRNAGESADMKVITLNKLIGKRKMKCLEIPHFPSPERCVQLKNTNKK